MVSSTNKTDLHDKAEILLKVSLNAMNPVTDAEWRQIVLIIYGAQNFDFENKHLIVLNN